MTIADFCTRHINIFCVLAGYAPTNHGRKFYQGSEYWILKTL